MGGGACRASDYRDSLLFAFDPGAGISVVGVVTMTAAEHVLLGLQGALEQAQPSSHPLRVVEKGPI